MGFHRFYRGAISIHAPAKGATVLSVLPRSAFPISIHAPAKGATCQIIPAAACPQFQSTLPRRERPWQQSKRYGTIYFNPRSREGSDDVYNQCAVRCGYFNPRSREGSDGTRAPASVKARRISIHAPAKGATASVSLPRLSDPFQSTLPRRERRHSTPSPSSHRYFNPRSREGSDRKQTEVSKVIFRISIHAPAKGATAGICGQCQTDAYFNPRSREGSDAVSVT